LSLVSPVHFGELIRAWLLLPVVAVGVRTLGLHAVRQWLETPQRARSVSAGTDPARLAEVVDTAARFSIVGRSCLTRALVLERLLVRKGVHAQLRIGVQRTGSGIAAHAWVEVDGVPVAERANIERAFPPFDRVGPRPG
jgi:hypothetical protein